MIEISIDSIQHYLFIALGVKFVESSCTFGQHLDVIKDIHFEIYGS